MDWKRVILITIGLSLIGILPKLLKNPVFDGQDLDYPDEDLVMQIAQNWSVNPTKLTQRNDIKSGLGLVGK